ncbi:MAG: hypothetical protein WCI17_10315, partial [bacterium]
MADENSEQAIPPKVVPPQIRILGAAAGSAESPTVRAQAVSSAGVPAPVPRTVRLKPIGAAPAGGIPAASSGPGLSPAAQSDAAVAGAAVDAVKRMTARIAVLSGEADAGKKRTGHLVSGDSGAKKATAAIAPISVMDSETTVKKVTSRIQMSATVAIPELSDTPKTIKIKPLSGTQPVGGTQPVPLVEPPAVVGQTAAQIAAGKSKTSRIPLESAMSMPQAGGASTSDPSGGAPKTIKLKR